MSLSWRLAHVRRWNSSPVLHTPSKVSRGGAERQTDLLSSVQIWEIYHTRWISNEVDEINVQNNVSNEKKMRQHQYLQQNH